MSMFPVKSSSSNWTISWIPSIVKSFEFVIESEVTFFGRFLRVIEALVQDEFIHFNAVNKGQIG